MLAKDSKLVSGVSIDFNGFLGLIFGNFILMIDVLVGRQRYIIVYPLLHTYMLPLLLEMSTYFFISPIVAHVNKT